MEEKKETVNRRYKDSVFVDLLMSDKGNALEIYNALAQTNLPKETSIEYINIESSLYTTLKNDVAFIIAGKVIVLLEHQSTINENMPFRFLLYIARLYEKVIKAEYRYLKKLIKIPFPRFYVLYNGKVPYPMKKTLRLPDAFIETDEKVSLQLDVEVININQNTENQILKSCTILNEYSQFVSISREYSEKKGKEGFKEAIDYCISQNILKGYLEIRRSEVYNFLIAEYDYDMDIKMQGEEHYNEGLQKGMQRGIQRGMQRGRIEGILTTASRMKNANFDISTIMEMTGLSREAIEKL